MQSVTISQVHLPFPQPQRIGIIHLTQLEFQGRVCPQVTFTFVSANAASAAEMQSSLVTSQILIAFV